MSKAFKCDRCKKCFDPWSMEDDREFGRIHDYACVVPSGEAFDYTYRDEELHLCPDCNRDFCKFLGGDNPMYEQEDTIEIENTIEIFVDGESVGTYTRKKPEKSNDLLIQKLKIIASSGMLSDRWNKAIDEAIDVISQK